MSSQPIGISRFVAADVHARCLERDDYLGHPNIVSVLKWGEDPTSSNADALFYADDDDDESQGFAIVSLVGTVLADIPYLLPHGNYDPKYQKATKDMKFQFSLGPGPGPLAQDFQRALESVAHLQTQVAETQTHQWLIKDHRKKKVLRLGMPIFAQRTTPYVESDSTDPLKNYVCSNEFAARIREIQHTHTLNDLRFLDVNGQRINPSVLEPQLVGAVVQVWFTIHHWPIKARVHQAAADTFGGRVVQVKVLRPPASMTGSLADSGGSISSIGDPVSPSRLQRMNAFSPGGAIGRSSIQTPPQSPAPSQAPVTPVSNPTTPGSGDVDLLAPRAANPTMPAFEEALRASTVTQGGAAGSNEQAPPTVTGSTDAQDPVDKDVGQNPPTPSGSTTLAAPFEQTAAPTPVSATVEITQRVDAVDTGDVNVPGPGTITPSADASAVEEIAPAETSNSTVAVPAQTDKGKRKAATSNTSDGAKKKRRGLEFDV